MCQLPLLSIKEMPGTWAIRARTRDDPKCVVVRLALNPDSCLKLNFELLQLVSDGTINRAPLTACVLSGNRCHLIGARVGLPPRDIGLIVAGNDSLHATCPFPPQHCRLVAAH